MGNDLITTPALRIGSLMITEPVLTTWALMLLLVLAALFATRHLKSAPRSFQTVTEGIVITMYDSVKAVLPEHLDEVFPFVATLWIFIVCANLCGVIPKVHSPTADISVTAALAVVVFLSVHWFGIRASGIKAYLAHYLRPNPIMLPFHIMSEISRTIALAVRLFGNMMSLNMAAMMILLVAGFLVPVPLLMLHIVEALVQAYIFGMLALIYIGSALQSQQELHHKEQL